MYRVFVVRVCCGVAILSAAAIPAQASMYWSQLEVTFQFPAPEGKHAFYATQESPGGEAELEKGNADADAIVPYSQQTADHKLILKDMGVSGWALGPYGWAFSDSVSPMMRVTLVNSDESVPWTATISGGYTYELSALATPPDETAHAEYYWCVKKAESSTIFERSKAVDAPPPTQDMPDDPIPFSFDVTVPASSFVVIEIHGFVAGWTEHVPEPCSLSLLALGSLALRRRRRRAVSV